MGSNWQYTNYAFIDKSIPEITSDIHQSGSVMVYWQVDNNWVALPVSLFDSSIIQQMGFQYNVGTLRIFMTQSDGGVPYGLAPATFKVVIMSGS